MGGDALTPGSTVARGPARLACQELDGELLIVNLETQRGYTLNRIGARIWQLLEQPTSVGALVAQLMAEFTVDAGACENEVREFLLQLQSGELVRIDSR